MSFSRDGLPFGLDPKDRSYFGAPTHSGVPVLDQDINIQQRIQAERIKDLQQTIVTDGWATRGDFAEVGGGSLYLIMGDSKAVVDGNVLQVKDFFTSDNRIPFIAANPASSRYDLVWLEVWYELVGSTDTIYKYGNVNYYGAGLENDLVDPVIGSLTTSRVQVRYRIRVTEDASTMSSATVLARGAMASPGAGKVFTEDTEKKHWYCNAGTDYSIVGGYVYALPIVKVLRAAGDNAINSGDLTDQRVLGVVNTDTILTTTGDLIVRGSSEIERLAAGAVGTILKGKGAGVPPAYDTLTGLVGTILKGKGVGVESAFEDFRLDTGGFAFGSFSRSTAGNEVITGVGFNPSLVIFLACDNTETNINWSVGIDNGTSTICLVVHTDNTKVSTTTSYSIRMFRSAAANYIYGDITAKSSDGFTVAFTLNGVAVVEVKWIAIK